MITFSDVQFLAYCAWPLILCLIIYVYFIRKRPIFSPRQNDDGKDVQNPASRPRAAILISRFAYLYMIVGSGISMLIGFLSLDHYGIKLAHVIAGFIFLGGIPVFGAGITASLINLFRGELIKTTVKHLIVIILGYLFIIYIYWAILFTEGMRVG